MQVILFNIIHKLVKNGGRNLLIMIAAACSAGCAVWSNASNNTRTVLNRENKEIVAKAPEASVDDAAHLAVEQNRLASEANDIARRQSGTADVAALTGILTLVAAAAAAIYAKYAAGESKRSADIAQQAFVASERAWISVDVTPEGPLKYEPHNGFSLEIGVHIRNLGKTPALNVHTDVAQISTDLKFSPDTPREFAISKRILNTSASRLLLPGQGYIRAWVPRANNVDESMPIFPVLYGCVTYQILPDESLHQTSFAMMITLKDGSLMSLLAMGVEVPQSDLELIHMSGAFAD